jgi:hypothetical protein
VAGSGEGGGSAGGWNTAAADLNDGRNGTSQEPPLFCVLWVHAWAQFGSPIMGLYHADVEAQITIRFFSSLLQIC